MSRSVAPVSAERAADESPDDLAPAPALKFRELRYTKLAGVATIALDRPGALNSYSTHTLKELAQAVRDASCDDSVGVIVLTGTGTRAFCTGGDVKEYASRYTQRPHDYWKYMALFRDAVDALLRCGKPTIARLNGITVGGGNELHLACDLSVAASHVYIGQVGVGVGSVAAGGATQWLTLAVGDRRARRMLFLNERIPAARALEWGLVSEVAPSIRHQGDLIAVPSDREVELAGRGKEEYAIDLRPLDAAVASLAERLLGMFPECLRYTKEQTNFWKELVWSQTAGHAQEWLALHFATAEPFEGMRAFVEKRPARTREIRAQLARGESPEFRFGPPARSCPKCGTIGLPAAFDFCGRCGTAVHGGGTRRSP